MYKSKLIKIFLIILILILLIVNIIYICVYYVDNDTSNEGEEWYDEYQLVAHGCGAIENYTYTNSKEALELSYEKRI